jgi:hypothetical protein
VVTRILGVVLKKEIPFGFNPLILFRCLLFLLAYSLCPDRLHIAGLVIKDDRRDLGVPTNMLLRRIPNRKEVECRRINISIYVPRYTPDHGDLTGVEDALRGS